MGYKPWCYLFTYIILYPNMRGNFFYKLIGEQIRFERKSKKISQEQLALTSDVDRTYMARIEEGKANPTVKILRKISRTLRIPLRQLLSKV